MNKPTYQELDLQAYAALCLDAHFLTHNRSAAHELLLDEDYDLVEVGIHKQLAEEAADRLIAAALKLAAARIAHENSK